MTYADWAHTLIAVGTAICALILLWWKVSSDARLTKAELKSHGVKIEKLETNKADINTVAKLAELIGEIDKVMTTHHTDYNLHRTPDSEKRMEDVVRSLGDLTRENREAHQMIMEKIEAKTRA